MTPLKTSCTGETRTEIIGTGEIRSIRYADGREVELRYDALRKLKEVKDWPGTTKIENDLLGRAVKITDHKERTVQYEWGKLGERKSILYPTSARRFIF